MPVATIFIALGPRACGTTTEMLRKTGTAEVASVKAMESMSYARTWLIDDREIMPKIFHEDVVCVVAQRLLVSRGDLGIVLSPKGNRRNHNFVVAAPHSIGIDVAEHGLLMEPSAGGV